MGGLLVLVSFKHKIKQMNEIHASTWAKWFLNLQFFYYLYFVCFITFGSFTQCVMTSFQCLFTIWKRRPSSGICFIISSELKMGSRYSHWCCTFSHSSIVSWIRIKRSSQTWYQSAKIKINLSKLTQYPLTMIKKHVPYLSICQNIPYAHT